jgi:hypothetical protein
MAVPKNRIAFTTSTGAQSEKCAECGHITPHVAELRDEHHTVLARVPSCSFCHSKHAPPMRADDSPGNLAETRPRLSLVPPVTVGAGPGRDAQPRRREVDRAREAPPGMVAPARNCAIERSDVDEERIGGLMTPWDPEPEEWPGAVPGGDPGPGRAGSEWTSEDDRAAGPDEDDDSDAGPYDDANERVGAPDDPSLREESRG